MQSKQNNISN